MADWRGRGGGRSPERQGNVQGTGGIGAGGGRAASQPTVESEADRAGRGGGRPGSQSQISSRSSWSGAGQGRSGSQPTIEDSSLLGTRSTSSTTAMTTGISDSHVADPEGNYIFALEIDGIEVAQFLECSGLKSSTTVFELEEGGMNHRVHKLPGQSRWENITLRYGVTNDVGLLEWRNEILQDEFGESKRRNGSIVVKNNQMEIVRRYNFEGAWPVAWEGPSFSATASELAIEMVEIAHHGLYVS